MTPVDIDAHGLRFVVYVLEDGEGKGLHVHPYEHGIFIVSGQVLIGTDDGEYAYSGPAIVFAAAGRRHSFKAVGRAVVINTIAAEDLISKVYV